MLRVTDPMNDKVEQLIVRADAPPIDGVLRLALGYTSALVWRVLFGRSAFGWLFALFLLTILVALRLGPLAIRRVVRFSPKANAIWAQRRQLAKHFDSYQWRKLFWIGVGLALFGWLSPQPSNVFHVLTAGCLISGAIGLKRFSVAERLPWPVGAHIKRG